MKIERVVSWENDQNCYIVYNEMMEALVIDPGEKGEIIYKKAEELGVKIKYILLTHCHYDHIEGLEELRKLTLVKVVSTFECNINIQNLSINLSSLFGNPITASPADIIVNDGEVLKCSDMEVKCITTPGHTNGSVCYLIDEDLFSGDTLFLRSVGRWDFPGGDEEILRNSIKNKIYTLDDDITVHPGHGNDTKIHYEKKYNMFIRG